MSLIPTRLAMAKVFWSKRVLASTDLQTPLPESDLPLNEQLAAFVNEEQAQLTFASAPTYYEYRAEGQLVQIFGLTVFYLPAMEQSRGVTTEATITRGLSRQPATAIEDPQASLAASFDFSSDDDSRIAPEPIS